MSPELVISILVGISLTVLVYIELARMSSLLDAIHAQLLRSPYDPLTGEARHPKPPIPKGYEGRGAWVWESAHERWLWRRSDPER